MVIACPLCGSTPPKKYRWICFPGCEAQWDTFATAGRCTGCGRQWTHTQCPDCRRMSPHAEWYDATRVSQSELVPATESRG